MPNHPSHSPEFIRNVIDGAYRRSLYMLNYKPSFNAINSSVVLYKPSERVLAIEEEDYGLSKCCRGSIEIRQLEGNHLNILGHPELNAALNKSIDELKLE